MGTSAPTNLRVPSPPQHVTAVQHRGIERVDARDFRAEILPLFEANGKPFFADQFDWYYRDKGQQTPTSWVLRDSKGRILGLCSVTIRNLSFGTLHVRAGIAGNLVVDRTRGAYLGPFSLVNAMKCLVNDSEIDVLLGIPNDLACPVFSRLDFKIIDRWTTYVQIAKSRDLLSCHFGRPGIAASAIVDWAAAAMRGLSHWQQVKSSGLRVIELTETELARVRFEEWPSAWHRFQTVATSDYLKWHFLRSPMNDFTAVGIVSPKYEVLAYLVLRTSRGRIWIADCGADHRRLTETLAILCFCHDRRALAGTVWIPTLSSGAFAQQLASCGFAKMPTAMGAYPDFPLVGFWRPDHPLADAFSQPSSWHLFSGFNDV
ncbi:MAG TPA: hypothetical protein VEI49_13295 [Terriglobales bacterium]|nr:hypothetical protein [Terriglobales bacterium]